MDGNLIICGKNSYIGNRFTRYVAARGAGPIALSSAECNFLERDQVIQFFRTLEGRPFTVVFFAVINKSTANSYESFSDNVRIVKNLIDGSKLANIDSIVYFSSVDVYGNKPSLPITERSKIDPDTWYGLAKYACEWMLLSSGQVGCPVTVLRIPGVYGHSPHDRSVIGKMASGIRNEGRVVIRGDGKALRDYVYTEDLCEVLRFLIPLKYHGVLNVATGESHSVIDVARLIGRVLQAEFEVVHTPEDPERDFDLRFDTRSLTSLMPDFRFTDMAAGIRSYCQT
jgi:UDP-glucose 4-epimerase